MYSINETASKWQFGVLPNYLATLVAGGIKTATCSARCLYTLENAELPKVGQIDIVLDQQNHPIVAIELTAVLIMKFDDISDDIALAEGEGNILEWRQTHQTFFQTLCQNLPENCQFQGVENGFITGDFEVVCEQFKCVHWFSKTYQQWLAFAEQTLLEKGNNPYQSPKVDANLLLQAVTKRSKSAIFAFGETELTQVELQQLAQLLARRAKGEPMAYILGEKEFWSLPLEVSTATLIPRPDTEILVEQALIWANKRLENQEKLQILDLGTGTGAIALALASELGEKAAVIGVDFQPEAVALAKRNCQKLKIKNAHFLLSNWFSCLENQQFDLIVSNPPYIDKDDENLQLGDVRFEPRSALVAEKKGFADLQKIIENAPLHLAENGALILEHGWQQAGGVQHFFQQNAWINIETFTDYGGKERVTKAIWTALSTNY
ncbi:release factor glutamine methyltransferase [Nicoletella semolina]|uniref:Release factor glutamine methyltransferase n=1 Tax=Nicoletella semolina TaxID=271160 RepID=A0A4R2N7M4_9PAST|nr:release factor glutamine methyltransferase [Nicoletella semolina]